MTLWEIVGGEKLLNKDRLVNRVIGFNGYNAKNFSVKIGALYNLLRLTIKIKWDLGIMLDLEEKVHWEPFIMRLLKVKEVARHTKAFSSEKKMIKGSC